MSRGTPMIGVLFVKLKVKVTQSCQTLCDPVEYTVHGILQARILEWVAVPNPGIKSKSPTLQAESLPAEPPGKPIQRLKDLMEKTTKKLGLLLIVGPHPQSLCLSPIKRTQPQPGKNDFSLIGEELFKWKINLP